MSAAKINLHHTRIIDLGRNHPTLFLSAHMPVPYSPSTSKQHAKPIDVAEEMMSELAKNAQPTEHLEGIDYSDLQAMARGYGIRSGGKWDELKLRIARHEEEQRINGTVMRLRPHQQPSKAQEEQGTSAGDTPIPETAAPREDRCSALTVTRRIVIGLVTLYILSKMK